MNNPAAPIPANELKRLIILSEFDLDYPTLQTSFSDLGKLAAKVAGTEMSLINLIDHYTAWAIGTSNLDAEQLKREDTMCQYTIMGSDSLEVKDLQRDDRFKNLDCVQGENGIRYYYGLPLATEGYNIGSLCVLDHVTQNITADKAALLSIIANQIIERLKDQKAIAELKKELNEANRDKLNMAHDIRSPLSGIVGISQIIAEQGNENSVEEVLEYVKMIEKSGNSLIDLAEDILKSDKQTQQLQRNEINLVLLKEKLERLYAAPALNKKVNFSVNIPTYGRFIPFCSNKLLQVAGNLISNAIKFTPEQGKVTVDLRLTVAEERSVLHIGVGDTGVGLSRAQMDDVLNGGVVSTTGTGGEEGFGFGLSLVKHLVDTLGGRMRINALSPGTRFLIDIPQQIPAPAQRATRLQVA